MFSLEVKPDPHFIGLILQSGIIIEISSFSSTTTLLLILVLRGVFNQYFLAVASCEAIVVQDQKLKEKEESWLFSNLKF